MHTSTVDSPKYLQLKKKPRLSSKKTVSYQFSKLCLDIDAVTKIDGWVNLI